jgi:restriction system protein
MPIPDFQTLMLPVLEVHADGEDWVRAPLRDALAARFDLTADERAEMLPSGNQRRFDNRLAWTLTHLAQAGLLVRPARGVTRITDRGRAVLAEHRDRVDMGVLNDFEEYRAFRSAGSRSPSNGDRPAVTVDDTPEEAIEAAHQQLTAALADDLLDKMLQAEPDFFEQLVVDVLVAMGYGGSKTDAGQRLGRSGDGGLDGVIREDRLGLDVIYVQAKRWDPSRPVGRPDVQAFAGALQGARASKGVFITTTTFSRQAQDFADSLAVRLILVDGVELARLMIEHGVGVTVRQTYELKRVDEDYFAAAIN